jgi:hypothetical protein
MINVEATPQLSEAITDFRLIANYPNPFNPSTMIHFEVAQAGEISLDIFDVQGRLVENLVSGTRDAGSYQVGFDAAGLSSGVYFARLSGAARSEMMKMVLMK